MDKLSDLCERSNFVDVPAAPPLMRARTAPDASTVCSTDDEDLNSRASAPAACGRNVDRHSSQGSSPSGSVAQAIASEESDAEDDSSEDMPPPPALMLESFTTPDWYENAFVDEDVLNPYASIGFDPMPTLPEGGPSMNGSAPDLQWPVAPPPFYPAPLDLEQEGYPSPPAEYPDGNPAYLCVRRTFLDICATPPPPAVLERSLTTPQVSTADAKDEDAYTCSDAAASAGMLFADGCTDSWSDWSEARPEQMTLSSAMDWYPETDVTNLDARPAYLRVKRTFLDFSPELLEPKLLRVQTAPGRSQPDDQQGLGGESKEEDLDSPPPPQLVLENFTTPDRYDNPYAIPASSHSFGLAGFDMLPTLPEGQPSTPCPPMKAPEEMPMVFTPTVHSLAPATMPPPARPLVQPLPHAMPSSPAFQPNSAMHLGGLPWAPPPSYAAPAALAADGPAGPPPTGEADAEELSTDGAPTVPGLTKISSANGKTRIFWALDARKLVSQDKQAVSAVFDLELPGEEGSQPFRLLVHPTAKNDGRRGAGFKKSKGKGRIELKCEGVRASGAAEIVFRFAVGRGDVRQPTRGVVAFNFADDGVTAGLPKGKAQEWDFNAAVDEFKSFLVILEVMPHGRTA